MVSIFLKFVNTSISAGWLVLAIILFRWIFPKMPKRLRPVFWGLVGLRLVLFFTVESGFSLIPSSKTISTGIMYMPQPEIHSGISVLNESLNPVIAKTFAPTVGDSANPLQVLLPVLAVIWLAGVIVMLALAGISALRLRRRVKTAVLLEEDIYQSENVTSPFVFGFRHPRIYLPFAVDKDIMYHVLLHEQMHIARRDHRNKVFGYLLLSLYWFHPLCHVAYRLFCKDIELACDEQVIKEFSPEDRADYAEALLTLSVPHRGVHMCPLAFAEVGMKERVKNVLNDKKPVFWAKAVTVIVGILMAVCFLTNPREKSGLKNRYIMEARKESITKNGYISLTKGGTFEFMPSRFSSRIYEGSYEVAGGRLLLWEMHGEWYIFDVVGDTLVFDAEASTKIWGWEDGEVFE